MSIHVALLLVLFGQAGAATEDEASRGDAVLAAAVRGVASELLTPEAREAGTIACVLLDRGSGPEAPGDAFMESIAELQFVRPPSACRSGPDGVVEIASGAPAFLIAAGPVRWVADDDAHVRILFRHTGSNNTERLYRVVRETSGWLSLGQIIEMAPA